MVVATEQLEILRGAGAFVFWPEGFMGRVGPELAAFRALQPLASSVALEVQASFAQATPAGRIYLCCLLNDADAALGGAAWSDLSASTSQVIVSPGGCTPRISTELGLSRTTHSNTVCRRRCSAR